MEKKRAKGIAIFSVYHAIVVVVLIIFKLWGIQNLLNQNSPSTLIRVLAFGLLLNCFLLCASIAFFMLKNWARITFLVFYCASFISYILFAFGITLFKLRIYIFSLEMNILNKYMIDPFNIAFAALMVFYLTRPKVKEMFR